MKNKKESKFNKDLIKIDQKMLKKKLMRIISWVIK